MSVLDDPARLNVALAAVALVVLVAVLAVRLAASAGLPSLLLYLGLGLVIGEAGLGLEFDDVEVTQTLGLLALALILAEGGLSTRWSTIRPVLPFALALATVGVAVSVGVVAVGAHLLIGVDWRTALLLGAVVSSTDAAAVFSVLRNLPLRPRLVSALEAESGLNDAPVVILVALLVSDAWAQANPWVSGAQILFQLVAGAAIGLAIGRGGQWLLGRTALPSAGLYPLATLALAVLAYAAAGVVGASGFIAVYVAALWLGNAALPHRRAVIGFADGVALLAQMGLFVLLGLLAAPSRLPAAIVPALVVGFLLTFLARPLSVVVCAIAFRFSWREQTFLSWAGLRGAVPIVLTTIPASAGVAGAEDIFDIVFVLVVVYTLVQAPTLPLLARRLGVEDSSRSIDVAVESAPLEDMRADLLQATVTAGSRLKGITVAELRLPAAAVVTLVVRDDTSMVPDQHTTFRVGDRFLVVADSSCRDAAEKRIRAVAEHGRLARWHGLR